MYKMRVVVYFLVTIFLSACSASDSNLTQNQETEQSYNSPYLFMAFKSQFGCAHAIILDRLGHGILLAGYPDFNNQSIQQFEGKKLLKKGNFQILSEIDMDRIKKIAEHISKSSDSIGGEALDAMKFELYLNGRLNMSYYKEPVTDFKKLYELMIPYLPFRIDFSCMY